MAKIVIECPFCQKKVETPEDNAGREGQCPSCENIFEIAAPERPAGTGGGWAGPAAEYEYRDSTALAAIGAVGVCLLLLAISTLTSWSSETGLVSGFTPGQRMALLSGSLACLAFLAISVLSQKTLMPAVIVSGGWGTVAVIWSWGIWQASRGVVAAADNPEAMQEQVGLGAGVLFCLIAGALVVAAALYTYSQTLRSDTFDRLGLFAVGVEVLAIVLGVLIVRLHVQPAVQGRAEASQQAVVPPRPAPPEPRRRPRRPPEGRVEPSEEPPEEQPPEPEPPVEVVVDFDMPF